MTTCVRLWYGCHAHMFSGFSREPAYAHVASRERSAYCQVRLSPRICLGRSTPTPFNRLFRQPAGLSLLRPRVTPRGSNGILTVSSIGVAVRLSLRSRLTLIRLALIRKPQSSGEGAEPGGFAPPLSLLIPTFAFPDAPAGVVPQPSARTGMLPYRSLDPTASAARLCPIIIHAGPLD